MGMLWVAWMGILLVVVKDTSSVEKMGDELVVWKDEHSVEL